MWFLDRRAAAVVLSCVLVLAACSEPGLNTEGENGSEEARRTSAGGASDDVASPATDEPSFTPITLGSVADWQGDAIATSVLSSIRLEDVDDEAWPDRSTGLGQIADEYRLKATLAWDEPAHFAIIRFRFLIDGVWERGDIVINPVSGQLIALARFANGPDMFENAPMSEFDGAGLEISVTVETPEGAQAAQVMIIPAVGPIGETYAADRASTGAMRIEELSVESR